MLGTSFSLLFPELAEMRSVLIHIIKWRLRSKYTSQAVEIKAYLLSKHFVLIYPPYSMERQEAFWEQLSQHFSLLPKRLMKVRGARQIAKCPLLL